MNRGGAAFHLGQHIGDCPFPHGTVLGRQWRAEYLTAQAQSEINNGGFDRRHAEARLTLAREAEPEGMQRVRALVCEVGGHEPRVTFAVVTPSSLAASFRFLGDQMRDMAVMFKDLLSRVDETVSASKPLPRVRGELACRTCGATGWTHAEWIGRQHPALIRSRQRGKVTTHANGGGKSIDVYHFEATS